MTEPFSYRKIMNFFGDVFVCPRDIVNALTDEELARERSIADETPPSKKLEEGT